MPSPRVQLHRVVTTSLLFVGTFSAGACRVADADADPIAVVDTVGRVATFQGRLRVPEGFRVTSYASGVSGVRFMTVGPGGALYVSQPGNGTIARLADANHDGVADGIEIVVRGLSQPHGLIFHKGMLWVANTDGIVRVPFGANGLASAPAVYVNHYPGFEGHSTRTVVFGADSAMYVSIGSSCNLCVEKDSARAAVMRYNEDGSGGRVYASGLRNAVGLAVHPVTGALWASQNERDNLRPEHQDLPPEEINIVVDHGDYGWPYCYGNRVPNPEFNDAARCAHTIPPALTIQAHSAPLGMSFLSRATTFPATYRGDLLVALHGSWNRDVPTGAKVVRVHVVDGKPVSVEDFITGWQLPDGTRWGRPADVTVAADGSILVSDDASGTIYRVTH